MGLTPKTPPARDLSSEFKDILGVYPDITKAQISNFEDFTAARNDAYMKYSGPLFEQGANLTRNFSALQNELNPNLRPTQNVAYGAAMNYINPGGAKAAAKADIANYRSQIESLRANRSNLSGRSAAGKGKGWERERKQKLNSIDRQIEGLNQQIDAARQVQGIDLESMSPGMQRSFDAYTKAYEDVLGRKGAVGEALNTAGKNTFNFMEGTAAEYAKGGKLSQSELRDVRTSTRSAMEDRGLGMSNAGIFAEALNRDKFSRLRLQEREAAYANAIGLGQGYAGLELGAQQLGGTMALNGANFLENLQRGRVGAAQGLAQSQLGYIAPSISYMTGVAPQGFQIYDQPQNLPYLLNYGSDLFNTNYNAQAAANIAGANNKAALWGAGIEAVGSILGGATSSGGLLACWVAREVFGTHNGMWLLFREWLFTEAPDWFFDLYLRHGEDFAKRIRNKPRLKEAIAYWMLSKIREIY